MNITLCPTSEIPDPGSKAFEFDNNDKTVNIFIIHKDGQFHGYINSCPHTGINLEWQEDQFLDIDQNLIQCSVHGALFETDTGYCIHGPCAGDNLTPVQIAIVDNILTSKI